jgi:hypothetical protein
VRVQNLEYSADGARMIGEYAVDEARTGRRPGILVCHEGDGASWRRVLLLVSQTHQHSCVEQSLLPVVLSIAKDLAAATRPVSDHSARSFAALRMTRGRARCSPRLVGLRWSLASLLKRRNWRQMRQLSCVDQDLFSVVLSGAKDLTPVARTVFDRSARSFAALRMTGWVWDVCSARLVGPRRSLARSFAALRTAESARYRRGSVDRSLQLHQSLRRCPEPAGLLLSCRHRPPVVERNDRAVQ